MKNLTLTELIQVAGGATTLGAFDYTVLYGSAPYDTLSMFVGAADAQGVVAATMATLASPNVNTLISTAGSTGVGSTIDIDSISMQFI